MKVKPIPAGISMAVLALAIARAIWPNLRIDGTIVMLIALAILPWLGSVFKSVELPGGTKVQYQDLQKTKGSAQEAGLSAAVG